MRTKTITDKRSKGVSFFRRFFVCSLMIIPMLAGGCSHTDEGTLSQEANQFFNQGNYPAALGKYEQLIENHPEVTDRVLFEMGITYAYPTNANKDYPKALACFQKVLSDYPDSEYRHDSQMMILQIQNVILKDQTISKQQTELAAFREDSKSKADEIIHLQEKVVTLEEKVFTLRTEPADRVLIEKQARRLTLFTRGEVIKTYKIALGGDPVGPKVMQGDNKTPEGTYIIDSRNGNSGFHLALHISYPNEEDKRRAMELGVSPGGDIMIHGLKNGFAELGAAHAEDDWTEGCIAVTNQEMEEIYRFVPNGTIVEILP